MSTATCKLGYDYLNPYSKVCGGRGECIDSLCECDIGWTGRSDWVDTTGMDCQVNYLAIRILWGVNLFVLLSVILYAIPQLRIVYGKFRELRNLKRSKGQEYGITDHKGFFCLVVAYSTWAPSHIALGILKIVNPSARVAIDILPTILWYISRTGFYVAVPIFQPSLLDNLMKGTKGAEWLVSMNYRFSWALTFAMVLIPLISIPNLVFNGENRYISRICVLCFFIFQATALTLYSFQAIFIRRKVSEILDKSYSLNNDIKTKDIRMNLTNMQHEVTRQAALQGFLYTMFAVFPYMWNKHDYILPISHFALPIVILKTTLAVSGTKKDRSARRETAMVAQTDKSSSSRGSTTEGTTGRKTALKSPLGEQDPIKEEDELGQHQDFSVVNPSFPELEEANSDHR